MDSNNLQFVEIVNRLKRGTLEGKLAWERTGTPGCHYASPLETGHTAHVSTTPNGRAVLLVLTNPQGAQTLHLDSSRVTDEVLKLSLLQLFVAVRDTLAQQVVNEALDAVKGL